MEDAEVIPFSSFMAGVLLVYKEISYLDFINLMTSYELANDADICDDDVEDKLSNILRITENKFCLQMDYAEKYDNNHTVEEYLYNMTTMKIRNFLGYKEKEITKKVPKKDNYNFFKRVLMFKKVKARA